MKTCYVKADASASFKAGFYYGWDCRSDAMFFDTGIAWDHPAYHAGWKAGAAAPGAYTNPDPRIWEGLDIVCELRAKARRLEGARLARVARQARRQAIRAVARKAAMVRLTLNPP